MKSNMGFGECLNSLLSSLDINANRLSKAINVDTSLVNRWVNGKRIPAYDTTYIKSISEYLSRNILNSYQIQHINDLFSNLKNKNNVDESVVSIKEKIEKILLESQGYSIERRKKERKKRQNHLIKGNTNSKFQKNISPPQRFSNNLNNLFLSGEDKLIFNTSNILNETLSLLETAANHNCLNNNTIYITYTSDMEITGNVNNDILQNLRKALLKAINNNGWHVVILLKLSNNIGRTIGFIDFINPLLRTGKLNVNYVSNYNNPVMGQEYIIIPGIGALLCFATKEISKVNTALFFRNNYAIDILQSHYQLLLKNYTRPLFRYYSSDNNLDYNYFLLRSEKNIGNHYLYKYCFSMITLPKNLYRKILIQLKLSNEQILTALTFYEKRLSAFLSNINDYSHKHIYCLDSMQLLIKHRKYYFYSYKGIQLVNLEIQDIIDHLENILNLLKKYANYNIAFINNKNIEDHSNHHFYCLIKERQATLIDVFKPVSLKIEPKVRISIKEPMVVSAFSEYFKEIWERIPPVYKDKNEVIAWIESQISLLKKQKTHQGAS